MAKIIAPKKSGIDLGHETNDALHQELLWPGSSLEILPNFKYLVMIKCQCSGLRLIFSAIFQLLSWQKLPLLQLNNIEIGTFATISAVTSITSSTITTKTTLANLIAGPVTIVQLKLYIRYNHFNSNIYITIGFFSISKSVHWSLPPADHLREGCIF